MCVVVHIYFSLRPYLATCYQSKGRYQALGSCISPREESLCVLNSSLSPLSTTAETVCTVIIINFYCLFRPPPLILFGLVTHTHTRRQNVVAATCIRVPNYRTMANSCFRSKIKPTTRVIRYTLFSVS